MSLLVLRFVHYYFDSFLGQSFKVGTIISLVENKKVKRFNNLA